MPCHAGSSRPVSRSSYQMYDDPVAKLFARARFPRPWSDLWMSGASREQGSEPTDYKRNTTRWKRNDQLVMIVALSSISKCRFPVLYFAVHRSTLNPGLNS